MSSFQDGHPTFQDGQTVHDYRLSLGTAGRGPQNRIPRVEGPSAPALGDGFALTISTKPRARYFIRTGEEKKRMDNILKERLKDILMEDIQMRTYCNRFDTNINLSTPTDIYKMVFKIFDDKDIDGLIKEFDKTKIDEKIKLFPEEMRKKSIKNFADFYNLDESEVNIFDVFHSSAGIRGWSDNYGEEVIL